MNLTSANNFTYTVNNNATFTFSNPPSNPKALGFTLLLQNGGNYTIGWPGSVQWAGGVAPALTSNGYDVLVFYTFDGGTNYWGFLSGADLR